MKSSKIVNKFDLLYLITVAENESRNRERHILEQAINAAESREQEYDRIISEVYLNRDQKKAYNTLIDDKNINYLTGLLK